MHNISVIFAETQLIFPNTIWNTVEIWSRNIQRHSVRKLEICKYNSEHGGAAERLLSRFHQRPVLLSRLPVSSFIETSMMCILIMIQMRTQIFTKGKSEFKNKCDDSGVCPTNNKIHRWVKIRPKQHTQETISSFPLPFWVDPGVTFSVRGKCCKTKIIPRRENLWSAIRLCYGAL